MALDVQCGCASKIEIVRTNSLTGEVTGVFPQSNIWTDAGLARISGYVTGGSGADWPLRLHYGSGQHEAPHNGVTRLAARIGDGAWGGTSNATYPDLDTVLVTRTASITVAARGVAWQLCELGLSTDSGASASLNTYTLTKVGGVVAPIDVAAIEILTITYTVQIQYPRRLPPQPVDISGDMVPTMATLSVGAETDQFARFDLRNGGAPYPMTLFSGAWNTRPQQNSTYRSGGADVWTEDGGNGTWAAIGSTYSFMACYFWELDPPITKNNTQRLDFSVYFTFTNGVYREP